MIHPTVIFKREQHRNADVLSIYSPNSEPFNTIVRKLKATYSSSKRMWWLPWSKEITNTAFKAFKGLALVDYSSLKAEREKGEKEKGTSKDLQGFKNHEGLRKEPTPHAPVTLTQKGSQRIQEQETLRSSAKQNHAAWTQAQVDAMWQYADKLRIRQYSESTYNTYGFYFKQFLAAHPGQDPKDITEEQIIAHVIKVVKEHNYANKTQNQIINAIKFYYEKVLGLKKKEYWIPRPRKETKLPTVASEEVVNHFELTFQRVLKGDVQTRNFLVVFKFSGT
jgi:hypothetical protein